MNRFAPLFVIIAASLWGFDGIVLRPSLYSLPVTLVVFLESFIVTLILAPFFVKQLPDLKILKHQDWLAFLGVAIFGGAIGTMAITQALFYVNFVNLSIVVLIQKLQPVFAIALASVMLKERPAREFYGWSALAIAGAYFMTFGAALPNFDTGDKTSQAAFFGLLAVVGFGSSTVFSKRALRNVGFEMGTFLRFLMTSIVMLPLVLLMGSAPEIANVTQAKWGVFLLIALFTGGPGIFLYYYGLKRITASTATICELAFPLTAVILEYVLRGNILTAIQWVGVIVLFVSILRVSAIKPSPVDSSK